MLFHRTAGSAARGSLPGPSFVETHLFRVQLDFSANSFDLDGTLVLQPADIYHEFYRGNAGKTPGFSHGRVFSHIAIDHQVCAPRSNRLQSYCAVCRQKVWSESVHRSWHWVTNPCPLCCEQSGKRLVQNGLNNHRRGRRRRNRGSHCAHVQLPAQLYLL